MQGVPLGRRANLLSFYRPDEASAFELWTTARKERPGLAIIFAEGRKKASRGMARDALGRDHHRQGGRRPEDGGEGRDEDGG